MMRADCRGRKTVCVANGFRSSAAISAIRLCSIVLIRDAAVRLRLDFKGVSFCPQGGGDYFIVGLLRLGDPDHALGDITGNARHFSCLQDFRGRPCAGQSAHSAIDQRGQPCRLDRCGDCGGIHCLSPPFRRGGATRSAKFAIEFAKAIKRWPMKFCILDFQARFDLMNACAKVLQLTTRVPLKCADGAYFRGVDDVR
jgi:hypothetical protein